MPKPCYSVEVCQVSYMNISPFFLYQTCHNDGTILQGIMTVEKSQTTPCSRDFTDIHSHECHLHDLTFSESNVIGKANTDENVAKHHSRIVCLVFLSFILHRLSPRTQRSYSIILHVLRDHRERRVYDLL